MKVLWIAYQPIPKILNAIKSHDTIVTGGWLQGIANIIEKNSNVELYYCFQNKEECEGKIDNLYYFSMKPASIVRNKQINKYKAKDYYRFKKYISAIKPDIIHIFGTEYWFQRQFVFMLDKLNLLDRTVIWIQGLTYYSSRVFLEGLSDQEKNRKTLWERIRGTGNKGIQNRLYLNGKNEIEVLKKIQYVFVRTDWDTACCKAINHNIYTLFCNETLRSVFYENKKWNINDMERHSIFVSQSETPLKGFHQVLNALSIIVKRFPDTILYTTGEDPFKKKNFIEQRRETTYKKIIREKIENMGLTKNVKFLGKLSDIDMRDMYLKSNVFVLSSSIENSSNSLGEAMILGVPIVAADVGGVCSMINNKIEGLMYPFSEYTLLAHYICEIFKDDKLAQDVSNNAKLRGEIIYNRDNNYKLLISGYDKIIGAHNENN